MHLRINFAALALLALTAIAGAQGAAKPLEAGDTAPALKVAKWLKGGPVTSFKDGKVHVIEFWATWCGPCKDSIPHLTQLAKKYKGKVAFTGVSVWEVPPDKKDPKVMERVSAFVKQMGSKMDYNVAADGPENTMAKTWLQAAEQDGIPTAFVVGRDGKVAWIGHPMADMDGVLAKVVAGTYDVQAEKARQEKEEAEFLKIQSMMGPLQQALAEKDERAAVAELDKLFAVAPKLEQTYGALKFEMMLVADETKAYPYAKQLADGLYRDNAQLLNNLAWEIVDDANSLTKPDYPLAVYIAEKAVAVAKGKDSYSMDTLAYAYFKNGDQTKGIATQEKAVALAAKDREVDKETLSDMKARLAIMKKKAGKV
ncbi:MAG: redoxin family protein [Fimbriimonas sp.]